MKNIFHLSAIATIFSFPVLAQEKIKVGYYIYPPHMIAGAKDTSPSGAAVDVMENHVAPKAKVQVEWVGPLPFIRLLAMLEKGEIDTIGLSVSTNELQGKFVFSKNAPLRGRQGILALKTSKPNAIKTAADLKGKIIGKLLGDSLPEFLERNKTNFTIEDVGGDNSAEMNLRKVLEGRMYGAVFTFPDVLFYYASARKELDKVRLVPYPGSEREILGYFPISKKTDPKIAKRLVDAINSTTKDYDYLKISQAYIGQAFRK